MVEMFNKSVQHKCQKYLCEWRNMASDYKWCGAKCNGVQSNLFHFPFQQDGKLSCVWTSINKHVNENLSFYPSFFQLGYWNLFEIQINDDKMMRSQACTPKIFMTVLYFGLKCSLSQFPYKLGFWFLSTN